MPTNFIHKTTKNLAFFAFFLCVIWVRNYQLTCQYTNKKVPNSIPTSSTFFFAPLRLCVKKNQVGKSQLSPKSVLISRNRVICVLIAAGYALLPLCAILHQTRNTPVGSTAYGSNPAIAKKVSFFCLVFQTFCIFVAESSNW